MVYCNHAENATVSVAISTNKMFYGLVAVLVTQPSEMLVYQLNAEGKHLINGSVTIVHMKYYGYIVTKLKMLL